MHKIAYVENKNLLERLLDEGYFVDNPCNGKGVCGKCKVRILSGAASPLNATEKSVLKEEEIEDGIRLSCLVQPEGELCVELLQKEREHKVLTTGYVPDFIQNPDIEKRIITIRRPTLKSQTPYEEQLREQLGDVQIPVSLLCGKSFSEGEYTAVMFEDSKGVKRIIELESGDSTDKLYGIAIDIGTTTVVTSLINLNSGEELESASMINAQKHFGLDVLTRITYELEHREGVEELQKAIVSSINDMIEQVCRKAGISKTDIYEIAVGANCTMMHTLLGIDAVSIGKAPYAPMFVTAKELFATDIGIQAAPGAILYCLPSVSAYIGADIVAGAYVCQLQKVKENVLFIDIGTNGEIVLSKAGNLLSCSCAAGPALEGMNISSGMRAAEGAIEDVKITASGIELKIIGNCEPAGVCGSGILAVVRELIKVGLIKESGAFIKLNKLSDDDYRKPFMELSEEKRQFVLHNGREKIVITQGDVRQVQLAKGAILSGFHALLNKAGITMEELDRVMIAGQFGAHLPADSLVGTGILPVEIEGKLEYVGNSSKTGAYMALMSKDVKHEMEVLAQQMDYMELGATEEYERLFSNCLLFPQL